MAKMTMVQALNLALRQEMEKDDRVIVLGEDVGLDGGVFRVTEGLIQQFGEDAGGGYAAGRVRHCRDVHRHGGLRSEARLRNPVLRIQLSQFASDRKSRRPHQVALPGPFHVPMVLRAPYGGGVRALEHHSESREAFWAHIPGLKMVIPSGPRNARALMVSAIRDPDPVIFYEAKALYRAFREEVPEEEETLPIGSSQVVREGKDLTLIAYGAMMRPTLEAADELKEKYGIEAEVIDLLTISPLDDTLFVQSVKKTGHAMIVHEAPRSFGPGAEIVARLVEKAFFYLEAPIARVTGYDITIPFFSREHAYLPNAARIVNSARDLLVNTLNLWQPAVTPSARKFDPNIKKIAIIY